MAAGDLYIFHDFRLELGKESHDLINDTFKLGLVTNAASPAQTATDPAWSTYSGSEVQTGTSYPADGVQLDGNNWALDGSNDAKLDFTDEVIAQDGTGFTNARYAIIYNDTVVGKLALGYVDLGGDISIQGGPLTFQWNANGIFRCGDGSIT